MEMKYTLCNYVMFENIICISHLAPSLFESSTSDLSLLIVSSVINCQNGTFVLDLSINIVRIIILNGRIGHQDYLLSQRRSNVCFAATILVSI